MPSRADRVRMRVEWAARAAALALLAWALWRAVSPPAPAGRVVDSAALHGALGAVLARDGATHVLVRSSVTPTDRDALRAARRSGGRVSWSLDRAAAWAAAVAGDRGPGGMVRVAIAGFSAGTGTGTVECRGTGTVECGGTGVVRDTLGVVDTVTLRDGGATVTLAPGRGLRVVAPHADIALAAPARDSLPWRALVLARAGWEAKFVMAALEEQGWAVSARLAVAQGAVVTQGPDLSLTGLSPDRALPNRERFDVIIVLDSARVGPDAARITRFVRSGGGVVLAGEGATALNLIAPARAAALSRAPRSDAVVVRASLPLRALTSVRRDAVVLDAREGTVAAAARAEGQGRVVQVGYDDTWRWRMQGGATAVTDHRAFWARVLASAAPERGALAAAPEGAPRARLVDAWGPRRAAPPAPGGGGDTRWFWPVVAALLVGEWASRRTRGAA